jgi:hypothetical protein
VPDPADGDGDIEGAGFLAEADDVDGLMDGCGAGGAVEGGVGPDDFAPPPPAAASCASCLILAAIAFIFA